MQAEATETQTSSDAPGAVTRYGKARFLTLADLDQRTAAYRETVKLIAEMEVDLGGADQLSSGERQLVQRAGVLGAVLSDIETRWISGNSTLVPSKVICTWPATRSLMEGPPPR